MAKTHFIKLFRDRRALDTMVNLRLSGWSLASLEVIHNCDKSSIKNQLEKYGVRPQVPIFSLVQIITPILMKEFSKPPIWKVIDGERIRIGKSYDDYLLEQKKRNFPPKV